MQLMCIDRDRVVLAKPAMLKYVHVLLCATQCESVKCTELCLWSEDIFCLCSVQPQGWASACSHRIKMQFVWTVARSWSGGLGLWV